MSQDGTDPNEILDPSDPAPWEPSMTPIPPIPEKRLASRLWREWNEFKAAAHATGIGGMDYSKWLIERIAKLTAEVERLIDKERETQAKLTRSALDVLALSSENTRLKSDFMSMKADERNSPKT